MKSFPTYCMSLWTFLRIVNIFYCNKRYFSTVHTVQLNTAFLDTLASSVKKWALFVVRNLTLFPRGQKKLTLKQWGLSHSFQNCHVPHVALCWTWLALFFLEKKLLMTEIWVSYVFIALNYSNYELLTCRKMTQNVINGWECTVISVLIK